MTNKWKDLIKDDGFTILISLVIAFLIVIFIGWLTY